MSIKLEEYTLPEHLSYSAFTTYLTCGYQYYLGRLLNKQESPSVWSVGGSAFHLACENYDKENMRTLNNYGTKHGLSPKETLT